MRWQIEYLEEAKKDLKKLDRSTQIIVLKGIDKVSENPLPAQQGGYGKPLGNKSGTNLTNRLPWIAFLAHYRFFQRSLYQCSSIQFCRTHKGKLNIAL